MTYHKGSTAPASPQGSDQAGQSSGDGSSSASSAPGTSGWQSTVSSNPAPFAMPSGDPNASGADDGGSSGAPSSDGGVGGGGGAGGSGGARTEAAGPSPQAAAAAIAADYQRILGRAPDAEGLATFTQTVLLGRMNLAQVAQTLATSPEARTDLEAVISDVQGRPATAQDDPWIQAQQAALANGSTTLAGVRQDLAGLSGEAGVVAATYQGLVGRAPSAAEIGATEGQLAAGVSLQSIRTTDASSPEAVAQLEAIYQSVLGRQADPSGLAACETELANGGTLAQVREATAQSPEAQADLEAIITDVQGRPATAQDDPWIQAQQAALASGSTTLAEVRQSLAGFSGEAGVVTSMYRGLVGRAPSAAEIGATEGQLAAGVPLQTIRTAGASSPEAVAQLDAIYQSVLGRQADPSGLASSEAALASGTTLSQLRQTTAHSQEAEADLGAVVSSVQGRQASAGDQPWIQAQENAIGAGSTSLLGAKQTLTETTASQTPGGVTLALRGVAYTLPSWHLQQIDFVKQSRDAKDSLRAAFRNVRGSFLKYIATSDVVALQKAGLTPEVIQAMASSGIAPKGYQVHHIIPVAGGGTNDFSNLILIRQEPDHLLITAYQNTMTGALPVGQDLALGWPVPNPPTVIWPDQAGQGALPSATSTSSS